VRYNVIRRPLSGGKGTIRQHQPSKSNPMGESEIAYYARLATYIDAEPETYFMRWKVEVGSHDMKKFCRESLDPILEQLCDWWEHVSGTSSRESPFYCRAAENDYMIHWRHPFGVYNSLDEGGASELDEYLASGSELGLERTTNLYPELGS
jgi:hypothetical protein